METKHTKGDWNVSKTVNDYAIHTEGSPKDLALVYEYSRGIPKEEAEANAKLIAAAPDMLDALQHSLNRLNSLGCKTADDAFEKSKIQQAISKAIH